MEKAFGKSETNAQFFYELLQGDASGAVPDDKIDGVLPEPMADAKAFPATLSNNPDKLLQGPEVVAAAFNRITSYYPKITAHFQALGLDLGGMLASDGSIKADFAAKVIAKLEGKDPTAPSQSLNTQAAQVYLSEKYHLSTRDKDFAAKWEEFQKLPQADRDAELKKFYADPKMVGAFVRSAFRHSEFSLLPFKDQVEVLKRAGYDEALVKSELGALWQGRGLPKWVAQAALLKGLEVEEEARALTGEDATKKEQEARMLFRAAVELDNQNPLARRRLATYLFREGKNSSASFHLGEAVKSETELRYLVEMVPGLEKGGKPLLGGHADGWSFVADNLIEAKRYADAAAVYHEAAKAATERGDHDVSIAFTEKELRVDEAGKPYILSFTKEANPIAMALYKALNAQGVPSALLDGQGDGETVDRKISPTEVFNYLDGHWKEDRVQKALRSLDFPTLPWEQPDAKLPYADAAFEKMNFPQKMSAWHRYEAAQLLAKEPVDATAVTKHLGIAALYEPKLPERHQALGDFLLKQKDYKGAVAAYQAADQAAGFADPNLKTLLGHAFFGLGEFKNSRDMYTAALEKKPKDLDLLKLRLEANQLYFAQLDPTKATDADAAAAVQAELNADGAYLMAMNVEPEKTKLDELETTLGSLHDGDADKARTVAALAGLKPEQMGGISKQDAIAAVEGLAGNYLSLAEQSYPDPKDTEKVRSELNGLAARCFRILKHYADSDADPEVKRMAGIYEASALFAEGKIDEAAELLKPLRKLPQAERILKAIENGQARLVNSAAVDAWQVYNEDMELAETDSAKGWASRTSVASVTEKWRKEKAITAAVKEKIANGEAITIEEALKAIATSGSDELKERAKFYLSTESRANGTGPIGDLIAYAAGKPPSASDASIIMQKAFDAEANKGAVKSSFALYSILYAASPEADVKQKAKTNMDALQGKAGFGRSVEKFFKMHSGEGLAVDVGLMFLAAGLGNLAKLRMLVKLEEAGVSGYKAVILANAVGIGVEATSLWGANTVKDAMFTDPSKVFSAEHLAKSYGSTLLMIGGLKGFGKLAEGLGPRAAKGLGLVSESGTTLSKGGKVLVWGFGQAGALGGMIATSKANQALHLTPKPVGGWKEGMVNDVFGYLQFAVAHKVADSVVKGKMTEVAQMQHTGIAFKEALLAARGQADSLGFKAEKYEIKVAKDGAVTANEKPLDSYGDEIKKAIEASLKKGQGDKIENQTVFLESPDRQLLVGLFVEASLNRPGFAGGKLAKFVEAKDYAKANAYLKEFKLPLHFATDGRLVAAPAEETSAHQALGITPPASEETPPSDAKPAKSEPGAKPAGEAHDEIPLADEQDIVLLEDGMTPEPETASKKLAARKTPPKLGPVREDKVEPAEVPPAAVKSSIPEALRRGLAVDATGKALPVDFNESGLAFLGKTGAISDPKQGGRQPQAEIAMTLDGGKPVFKVRAIGSEKLHTVDEQGQDKEVTASYRTLSDGDRIRIGGTEYTWFGPSVRNGLSLKTKVLTVFAGKVHVEDITAVEARGEWARDFVTQWEKDYVGKSSMFGDPANHFAERVKKDPRLSNPEFRASFIQRSIETMNALKPILDQVPAEKRSDLAYAFMKQVLEGKLTLGDATDFAASVASKNLVFQPIEPFSGKTYNYLMVPAFKGVPVPKNGALLEGAGGVTALEFNTVYVQHRIDQAVLQFNQGMPGPTGDHNYYVQNRSAKVDFSIFDAASGHFVPVEPRQNVKVVDGSVLKIGETKLIFHSPEALQREILARNEILADREMLTQKRGEISSLSDGTPDKPRELARLAKLEQAFRDRLKAQGRDVDGVSALQKEWAHLALTDTEFAKAARRALQGAITPEQYQRAQIEIGKQLVAEHQPALENVRAFLSGFESNPLLGGRLAELTDGNGQKVENPHSRLKDPGDIAAKLARRGWTDLGPLTDVAGARVVVRTTNDALPIVKAIEDHYKVRPQIGADGAMELDIIGQEKQGEHEVFHVTSIPDKDHPDRLTVGTSSGYRALHVVVEIGGKPVEIQIQTEAIYEWGKIQHSLIYKNKGLPKETFDELNAFCRDAAKYLTRLESGPAPGERPTQPLIPKSLKPEQRTALAADLKKMSALMDRFEERAEDQSLHNTQVFKRPPSSPPDAPAEKPSAGPEESFSEEAKTGVHVPSGKGKGRLPARRALPEDMGQAEAVPNLPVDPAVKPANQRYEIPVLKSTDGQSFRLPSNKNPVTLGSKDGNVDVVLKQNGKSSAPLHAEISRGSDGNYHLRPLAGQAVFILENGAWRQLDTKGNGESHLLRPGDRIKLGGWEFQWNVARPPQLPPRRPLPPPLPGKKGPATPSYREVSDRAAHTHLELTHLVDASDAFTSGEDTTWSSSFANIYTPDRTHLPIRSGWHHLSEGEYDAARSAGTLKDTPGATYEVRVYGEQRKADIEARLKAKYGARLEKVDSAYPSVSEWILRNERGEAQLGIKISSQELKLPSAAEAKAIYAKFAKEQLPRLLSWAGEETGMRGLYAFRILTMIGVEGDGQGGQQVGGRVAAAIERMERAPTAEERGRAAEELATMLAYLRDVPLQVLEHRLTSSAMALRDGAEVTWGLSYAIKQGGEVRERGNSAYQLYFDLRRSCERLCALGEELRKDVPFDQQKKGNPVFDEYVEAMKQVKDQAKGLGDFLQFLRSKGIDPQKLAPKVESLPAPKLEPVDDEMIVEIKTVTEEKSDRDVHGAEDRPTHDLRQFDESELENLQELGVANLDGLRDYSDPKFSHNVVNALAYLLNHHLKSREYESGVVRLVGALRHWEMYSGQKITWLNGYLHQFGRNPYGVPLESVPPPVPPPFRVPLNPDEQRSVGYREINPANLMKIIAVIRARSTPLEKIGDFMPFLPNEEDRRILTKIMGNYAVFVHKTNPKLGAYLEAMFKPGEAYAAALELKDPDTEDKLPERRPESAAALVAVPTPRLGEPTGAYVEDVSLTSPLGKELKSLARPRPTFVEEVPGLTPALEKIFDRGGRVEKWPSGMMLVENPSGAETRIARPASPTEVISYLRWYQRQGFAKADAGQTVQAWKQLEQRAKDLNIQLVLGEDVAEGKPEGAKLNKFLNDYSGQVVLLNSLLQLLPSSALAGSHINRIHFRTPRQENAHFGAFDASDGSLYLYSGGFEGSRRNLAALFLHELGHPTALRYHPDAKGDPMIPLSVRKQMLASQETLAKLGALYAMDWGEGYESRRGKQAASFDEFLADLQMAYVAAGPSLRAHIRGFREGTPERQAWDFVYSELRDRVFGGLEYDFVNPSPPPKPGLKVLPGGKAKAATPPPVPALTMDAFLRGDIGPQNAVKALRLGGLSAGRDPGVGRHETNEDRFAVVRFLDKDGRNVVRYFAIDGMGGHEGGEFAASFSQFVLQQAAKNPHLSLEAAIQLADKQMQRHPEYQRISQGVEAGKEGNQKPGAVVVGVEVREKPDGQYEIHFADVGDSEAMVFTPDFQVDGAAYTAKEPRSAKKLPRGQTIVTRIDPFAHMVDQAVGGHYRDGKDSLEVAVEAHQAKRGSVVVAGTDGLMENFKSKDEIGDVLRSSGAQNSAEMELALRNEALIRMHLFQAFREQRRLGQAITHADYVTAYKKVWKKSPPPGTWRYEGMLLQGQGHVVDPSKDLNRDGIPAYFAGHFKLDNLTVIVQVLGEKLDPMAAQPRPDFLPPPLAPLPQAQPAPRSARGGRP